MDTRFLATDNGRLAYDVRGDGPLVICSPGMGDERDAFHPLADRLAAAGHRVVTVDLRGHGDSDATFTRYGDEATADDLVAVMDELGAESAVLVGASMSAGAAALVAGRTPQRVDRLVLCGPFLRNGGSKLSAALMTVALLRPWGPGVWRSFAASLWPGLPEADRRARAARVTANLTDGRWHAFRATVAGADHSVLAPWLAKITAPALIVMGTADPDWPDPAAEAAWIAQTIGAEVMLVPEVGHAPMLEAPDAVATRVAAFLAA
ncbi:alpha/beta fold hydrolase [Microbacterium gorillae]|uniref:alpha/beta fold hydrolase n=1 Tax=Microbacterium gorillae TaxID=1231063 RepID=UPI00058AD9CC|nr:alpha/beta hydrolase [Microbacterium gorillae]